MIKEHLVSASITTDKGDCICNPEILLGTNFGLWDFKNEVAPRGTLLDLNAAWELFLSRQKFSNISFEVIEHRKHEVIDGQVYEEGDMTFILKDDEGNPTGASFTIKANKGPIEHIEWEKGKLYLYYRKYRSLEDSDLESGAPLHYVTDDNGEQLYDDVTGKPLIYDYVTIPVIEIFDNDETHSLFPWFADENDVVQLRDAIDGSNGHLGSFAITPQSEVYYAPTLGEEKNLDLVSLQSVQEQFQKDLGFKPTYEKVEEYPDQDDGEYHTFRANGSDLAEKLLTNDKSSLVNAINEDYTRTLVNTKLIGDLTVSDLDNYKTILEFTGSIKNQAFKDSDVPNLLAAINWMQENEIGPFKEDLNPNIEADTITEALNNIFANDERGSDRIGRDSDGQWIELNTDRSDTLTEAINEVDEHVDELAKIVGVQEEYDTVNKKSYYSNPDLNNITKNRLRTGALKKDDITVVEAINELQSQIGNLSSSASGNNSIELTTDHKDTLVEAINEVDLHTDNNTEVLGAYYQKDGEGKKQGVIANLTTDNQTSIVAAINELNTKIGDFDNLDTDSKDSIIDSINEIIKKAPFVYQDVDNPDSGVILKDQNNHVEDHSLAVGSGNDITSESLAVGTDNVSQGNYTLINGESNTTKKTHNFVTGKSNINDGYYNLINGNSNTITGSNNIVSGSNNNVSVENSTILGDNIIAKNSENLVAIGSDITFKDSINEAIALGSGKVNGDSAISIGNNTVSEESTTIGHNNETEGPGNVAIGDDNFIGCDNSYTFGYSNRTEGDHSYVIGEDNIVTGDNNYIIGTSQTVKGNNNVVIGNNRKVETNNSITIGEFEEPQNNATNIGKDIYIQTHNTESQLQKLIFVDLNDWCKKNHSAALNGEKFLDTEHVVNAIKAYKFRNYSDQAILRFTMQDNNENGFIVIQGKATRICLNGTWYYSDNIENGWSRHDGEYLKVIKKKTVDNFGQPTEKYYLALMDQLSTESVVDTVGAQRSNTEDFGTIDLTHAYGAVDVQDLDNAMNLTNRFNQKVDKYAKIITNYQDNFGVYSEKEQNFIDPENPNLSGNITLDLQNSFGFNKFEYQRLDEKGVRNGYVPLDKNGLIDSAFLPSFMDDVVDVWAEYTTGISYVDLLDLKLYELDIETLADGTEYVRRGKPILQGERGKIYVEAQPSANGRSSYQFRWTGTKFIVLSSHTIIGEIEGTAFDAARGIALEEGLADHIKSGITSIPVRDEHTGDQLQDENGNYKWVTYKPNPHNVQAWQLPVTVNDPNDPDNEDLTNTFYKEYNVDSAIKQLFSRINSNEDRDGTLFRVIGTAEDFEKLDQLDDELENESPTLISLALENKDRLDNINPISDVEELIDEYFNLDE